MTAELETIAASAATTLVGLMATDVWKQARSLLPGLWRRVRPGAAAEVEAELDSAEQMVALARRGNNAAVEKTIRDDWTARIADLLLTDPRVRHELERALHQMESLAAGVTANNYHFSAQASGRGKTYQSGGDMVINE